MFKGIKNKILLHEEVGDLQKSSFFRKGQIILNRSQICSLKIKLEYYFCSCAIPIAE